MPIKVTRKLFDDHLICSLKWPMSCTETLRGTMRIKLSRNKQFTEAHHHPLQDHPRWAT